MWKGHDAPVTAVTALPDGQRALSCSEDWTLKMWDVASGTVLCAFHDEAPVKCLAVSDDLCVVAGNTLGRVCILKIE
jgi:WD40 repeat protein